jgi:hypothetical protein
MSIYDVAHARALRVWKKARREGWLDEHLRGNTRGKKASKQAFTGGYLRAIIDFETIVKEQSDGQLLEQGNEQDATQHEGSKVRPRNKPNLSRQTDKGEV